MNSFGSTQGSGPNQLSFPTRIILFAGTLFVTDLWNSRLMLFDADTLAVTGQLIVGDENDLSQPYRIAININGSVMYVASKDGLYKMALDWT